MGDMQFHLSFNNGEERLQLPVNPSEIIVRSGYAWQTVSLARFGDYKIPSGHTMSQITLSSFFPAEYAPYCEYEDILSPIEYVSKIAKWKESRKPIRLVVTGTWVNYAMTIDRFDFGEKAGAPGDIYYTLDLSEYRFISVKKIDLTQSTKTNDKAKTVAKAPANNPRPNLKETPKSYTVKSGDSLTKIVQRLRTQGVKDITVDKLYKANKSTIGKNPNVIKPGQKLVIP
jgi:nucleoid-associated protein YgaU